MNISISEKNQERIRKKVESGRYGSPDEVIARALELLDESDEALAQELADVRAKAQRGAAQADAGQLMPASQVFEELRQRNAALDQRAQ